MSKTAPRPTSLKNNLVIVDHSIGLRAELSDALVYVNQDATLTVEGILVRIALNVGFVPEVDQEVTYYLGRASIVPISLGGEDYLYVDISV